MAGLNYQRAIESYVKLLNANGIVAILDLHWSDGKYGGPEPNCNTVEALCQKPLPDLSAVTFWKSVSAAFKGNDSVIFDLFNEPFTPTGAGGSTPGDWRCWLDGGKFCSGLGYSAAGMQALVNAVRSAGATNVLMIAGLQWANDLSRWLAYEPHDPLHDVMASWHSYDFNSCNSPGCWNRQVAPVMKTVPVVAGEIGESNCGTSFLAQLMNWMDARMSGYLAFTWDVWHTGSCGDYPALITQYSGTASHYGAAYRAHLQAVIEHSSDLTWWGRLPPHFLRTQ